MKPKNIFLTFSLVSFAIGLSGVGESIFWDFCLPAGAILFCLFMIFNLLENETALLDEQNRDAAASQNSANFIFCPPALEIQAKPAYRSSTLKEQIAT